MLVRGWDLSLQYSRLVSDHILIQLHQARGRPDFVLCSLGDEGVGVVVAVVKVTGHVSALQHAYVVDVAGGGVVVRACSGSQSCMQIALRCVVLHVLGLDQSMSLIELLQHCCRRRCIADE